MKRELNLAERMVLEIEGVEGLRELKAINEQLLEALKDLHAWVYRNVEWGCVPREIIRAKAAIATAEAAKGVCDV